MWFLASNGILWRPYDFADGEKELQMNRISVNVLKNYQAAENGLSCS